MTKIVFSDVDGTLLNSSGQITSLTLDAIKKLEKNNIPFVITSGRGPTGIYPILEEYGFTCPIISYGGALILNKDREVLFSTGLSKDDAKRIVSFIEDNKLDTSWCVYSMEQWIVNDKNDPRVIEEEISIKAESIQGDVDSADTDTINKMLCICDVENTDKIESVLKDKFPEYDIVKSADTLIEIMKKGVNKATAIEKLCSIWDVDIENTIAFGDNYNDLEMLEAVGHPFLMSNAPDGMKEKIKTYTQDNNNDGIYCALNDMKLI